MSELDEFGRSPLHYAAVDGDLAAVERLLNTEDVNLADAEGWTPLHFAARSAAAPVVERLLDAGADIDAVTEKGMPAIYWAAVARSGDPVQTIRVLRARGADPTRKTIKDDYFPPESPLYFISESGIAPEIRAEFADLLDQEPS
ncbi:ankyrin repeat domain-containing protein [Nocardia wallacei]|uniref:ankyrin repeat domain-containing protein n=1 Tax=Nocardia wallacei TaxID=480035 RepID=UPI002456621B|nr:ankyrin repeat domain-containing protein [Nocardia wallacei]